MHARSAVLLSITASPYHVTRGTDAQRKYSLPKNTHLVGSHYQDSNSPRLVWGPKERVSEILSGGPKVKAIFVL